MHVEGHDTLGHAVGVGGHAAVGPVVGWLGAHDGDDGAVGADMDVVWGCIRKRRSMRVDLALLLLG